jgi:DNA-binding response OmpR family regulator
MSKLVAVVDDEPDIVELVSLHLEKTGFNVAKFFKAANFLKFLESTTPDLVILDLMLPDADGFEICKYIKKQDHLSSIPIIMLTAKGEEMERILGLELGADDYVTKPFSVKELVARVKVVLRRPPAQELTGKIDVGGILSIDAAKHEVLFKEKKILLTTTEFKILKFLAEKKGWVFTRDQILDHLWGQEKAVVDRTVDVHIKHLREKLGSAAKFIKNVRGVGYKLEE